jgi:hypothetical protein
MDVPFPPGPMLLVRLNQEDLLTPRMEVRRFELVDYLGGKDAWADYEER